MERKQIKEKPIIAWQITKIQKRALLFGKQLPIFGACVLEVTSINQKFIKTKRVNYEGHRGDVFLIIMEAVPEDSTSSGVERPQTIAVAPRKSVFRDLLTPNDAESRYFFCARLNRT